MDRTWRLYSILKQIIEFESNILLWFSLFWLDIMFFWNFHFFKIQILVSLSVDHLDFSLFRSLTLNFPLFWSLVRNLKFFMNWLKFKLISWILFFWKINICCDELWSEESLMLFRFVVKIKVALSLRRLEFIFKLNWRVFLFRLF